MSSRIVFLDFDGVVNRKIWTQSENEWIQSCNYPSDNSVNDIQAIQWVSKFCLEYGYNVVVTSSWRIYANYSECLINAGFNPAIEIQGCVDMSPSRIDAIKNYINLHDEIDLYLIFDDESLKELKEHLVLCDYRRGFGEVEYNKAVHLHKKFSR